MEYHVLLMAGLLMLNFDPATPADCFSSPSTKLTCECHTEAPRKGVCTLVGTFAVLPEITHQDTTYDSLVIKAAPEGATVATLNTQTMGLSGLTTLRLEGVRVGKLESRSLEQLAGMLRSLHLVDNHIDAENISADAFQALSQLRELEISGSNLPSLMKWFDSNDRLQYLYVPENNIKQIDNEVFSRLTQMTVLDLSRNAIEMLSADKFQGPANLKSLSLGSNKLNSLSKDVFMNIQSLETLDLSHNNIGSPAVDLFSRLGDLKTLRLRNNSISQLPAELFSNNRYLQHISLDYNQLENVHSDLLVSFLNIQEIKLSNNKIASLPLTIFREHASIQDVDLGNNMIQDLGGSLFSGLAGLRRLYLNGNKLTSFSTEFEVLPEMMTLDLSHNNIEFTDLSGAFMPFRNMGKLAYLYLQNNQIKDLPDNLFSGLESLKELNLSSNTMETMADRGFISLVSLDRLDLCNNSFDSLPTSVTKDDLRNLKHLHLGRNMLTDFNSSMFNGFDSLESLHLDHCGITVVTEGMFDMSQLMTLDLSHNSAVKVTGSPFHKLTGLKFLHMRASGITSLSPGNLGGNFQALMEIDLSDNDIESLPANVFTNLTFSQNTSPVVNLTQNQITSVTGGLGLNNRVLTLDLRSNSIRCLAPSMADDKPHMAYYLSENPLICNCYLVWARALTSCTTSLGGPCVKDIPSCTGSGNDALDVRGTPCLPWKCPSSSPSPAPANTSTGRRVQSSVSVICAIPIILLLLASAR